MVLVPRLRLLHTLYSPLEAVGDFEAPFFGRRKLDGFELLTLVVLVWINLDFL